MRRRDAGARLRGLSGGHALRLPGRPEGLEAQARLVFENVGRALGGGGGGWRDVVTLTLFLTSVDDLATVRRVRDEFVDTARAPTSSLVQVAGLIRPDLLTEVEAVAAVYSTATTGPRSPRYWTR